MTAEVQQLAPVHVRVVKLFCEAGERIRRIVGRSNAGGELLSAQVGACITVPQTLQVRSFRLP
jgi:hypothetical protein